MLIYNQETGNYEREPPETDGIYLPLWVRIMLNGPVMLSLIGIALALIAIGVSVGCR